MEQDDRSPEHVRMADRCSTSTGTGHRVIRRHETPNPCGIRVEAIFDVLFCQSSHGGPSVPSPHAASKPKPLDPHIDAEERRPPRRGWRKERGRKQESTGAGGVRRRRPPAAQPAAGSPPLTAGPMRSSLFAEAEPPRARYRHPRRGGQPGSTAASPHPPAQLVFDGPTKTARP